MLHAGNRYLYLFLSVPKIIPGSAAVLPSYILMPVVSGGRHFVGLHSHCRSDPQIAAYRNNKLLNVACFIIVWGEPTVVTLTIMSSGCCMRGLAICFTETLYGPS